MPSNNVVQKKHRSLQCQSVSTKSCKSSLVFVRRGTIVAIKQMSKIEIVKNTAKKVLFHQASRSCLEIGVKI